MVGKRTACEKCHCLSRDMVIVSLLACVMVSLRVLSLSASVEEVMNHNYSPDLTHLLQQTSIHQRKNRSEVSPLIIKQEQQPVGKAVNESVSTSDPPELFMERLNRLLPKCPDDDESTIAKNWTPCDYDKRLFAEDVEKIENELLNFKIPKKIVLHFNEDSEYISIQFWRWIVLIDGGRKCPNCEIRHPTFGHWNKIPDEVNEPGHVRIHHACPSKPIMMNYKEHQNQITIGGCGESQAGSGHSYFNDGIHAVDYNSAFHDPTLGPFQISYAHLHFSPPNVYNLPELMNVTDLVRLLLRPPLPFPRDQNKTEDVSFSHNDCGYQRGNLVHEAMSHSRLVVAAYGRCFHNRESNLRDQSCKKPFDDLYHKDCEAHRDSTKTVISSWHKFTFALENTLSKDYFTEKRYQVLYGGSVPIVWNNHNSKAFLPDPDSAFLVNEGDDPVEVGNIIHQIAQNEKDYSKFFEWKKRGLRPDFVRKLFLSTDYLACRVCEYMAHHHFKDAS